MSDVPRDDWWQASDGRWYPPGTQPGQGMGGPQRPPTGWYQDENGEWRPPPEAAAEVAADSPGGGARRWAIIAVTAVALAVGVTVGLLVAGNGSSPAKVHTTEVQPAATATSEDAPAAGSTPTVTALPDPNTPLGTLPSPPPLPPPTGPANAAPVTPPAGP